MRERAAIFITLLFSYAYFFGGSGFNQNSTFALTRALVERHQLDIQPYASNTADVSFHEGRVYSNKAPGLSFLTAGPYALYYALHGAPRSAMELNVALYLCTVATCGIAGALLGLLLVLAFRKRGLSPRAAFALALVTGLGTPLFAYATMLFPHVPAALLVLLSFLLIDGTLPRNALLAGLAIGAATLVHYLCAPVALLFGIFLFVTSRQRWPETLRYVAGGLPFAIALGAYQLAAFGSPFRTSIAAENPAFRDESAWLGVLQLPRLDALWGITFSPYRGLFFLSPILLLAIAGIVVMMRTTRAAAWTIVSVTCTMFVIHSSFNGWHGGYTIGPRYILHVVPLLALGLVELQGRMRLLTIALVAISLLFNVAVTVVDPQPPDRLRDPVAHYALPALVTGRALDDPATPWLAQFYTGHTSTNRVAADESLPFTRHRPGSPESEWASFNLGELLFGAGSAASLLPWVLAVGMLAVAMRRPSP